jgi:hypothetical protein
MAKYNALEGKSFRYLCEAKKEYVLSKQILRSGTPIGTNIEEGIGGQSGKDFFANWLKYLSIFADADELGKIPAKSKSQ